MKKATRERMVYILSIFILFVFIIGLLPVIF